MKPGELGAGAVKVTVKADARHVPERHRGGSAEVLEERRLSFGRRWCRVRFADGCDQWIPEERVECATRLIEMAEEE